MKLIERCKEIRLFLTTRENKETMKIEYKTTLWCKKYKSEWIDFDKYICSQPKGLNFQRYNCNFIDTSS